MLERQRGLLADLHVGQVVVPDPLGRLALGEEQQVGLHAGAGGGEHAARQREDAPQVALVRQLALGLDEGVLVRAEQHALVDDHAAAAAVSSATRMTCCRNSTCVALVR